MVESFFRIAFISLGLVAATVVMPVHAAPYIANTGIGNEYHLTFGELPLVANDIVDYQFSELGVTFGNYLRYNQQGQANFPGVEGDYISAINVTQFSILFLDMVSEASFGYASNPMTVRIEALRDLVVIESFEQYVTYDNPLTAYIGFTDSHFNEIRVTIIDNEFETGGLIDNLRWSLYENQTGTPVSAPASWLLLTAGAFLISGRRKKQSSNLD